jgi:hypothetical protein
LANAIDDTETVTIGRFKVSTRCRLTKHQQTELVALLESFRHLFVDDISDLALVISASVSADGGKPRACVDYRELNDRMIKDRYPLSRIDDILEAVGGSAYSQIWT